MKLRYWLFCCFTLAGLVGHAQDVHYSYYQFAPTVVNPALTGAYYGNIRATAIHRGQWFNVGPAEGSNDGFTSTSLLVDGNLPFGFRKNDWISVGINLLIEGNTAGFFGLKRSFSGLSASYHFSLSEKNNSVLTAGLKYGTYGLGFTTNQSGQTGNMLENGVGFTEDQDNQSRFSQNENKDDTNDFMFGLMLTTPVGDKSDIRIGIAADHFLEPRLTQDTTSTPVPNNQGEVLTRRLNAFVQYYTDINDQLTFNPSIVYQSMGKASNILFQGLISYTPNNKQDITLNAGLGVRVADNMDVPIYIGADFKDWRVGLAFDTNVSGLTQATSNAGAYELAVTRIFSWEKKAKINPKFICPRL